MFSYEEALKTIVEWAVPLGEERVNIVDALGRVIAERVVSGRNIPPWDNSSMDGFAVRASDVESAREDMPVELTVIGDLPAGKKWSGTVGKGEAVRIMTGAPVPDGADAVVRVEDTREITRERVRVMQSVRPGTDIRRAGEDVRTGDMVFAPGTRIRPAEMGMLAALNQPSLRVFLRPRVAFLTTGSELADLGEETGDDRIISSNTYSLTGQVVEAGGIPLNLGIAPDDPGEIRRRLEGALTADILVTSAGVSVGEYDFVKDVFQQIGIEVHFFKVRIRPGRPLTFGTYGNKLVFGLPGNPVSSMVCFEEFVRPAVRKMGGHARFERAEMTARAREPVEKPEGLTFFFRCRLVQENGEWWAETTGPQGSGILSSMVQADGLMIVPEGQPRVEPGEPVRVHSL